MRSNLVKVTIRLDRDDLAMLRQISSQRGYNKAIRQLVASYVGTQQWWLKRPKEYRDRSNPHRPESG